VFERHPLVVVRPTVGAFSRIGILAAKSGTEAMRDLPPLDLAQSS
jgi:hypothetical protein